MTDDNLKPENATDANVLLADSKKFAYDEAHSIALCVDVGKPFFCEKRTAGLAAYVPCKIQCGDCANKTKTKIQ